MLRPVRLTTALVACAGGGLKRQAINGRQEVSLIPIIKSRVGYPYDATQCADTVMYLLTLDKGILNHNSFAQNAFAFSGWPRAIEISRSSLRAASSLRKRLFPASSGLSSVDAFGINATQLACFR